MSGDLDAFSETLLPLCTILNCPISRSPVPGDGRCPHHIRKNTCACCREHHGDHYPDCATLPPKPDDAAWQQRWEDVQNERADVFYETSIDFALGYQFLMATDEDTCTCIREQMVAKVRGLA